MRFSRVILAFAIVAVLCLSAGIVMAQTTDKAVTVADILKEAKYPLTQKQLKDLLAIQPGQGSRDQMNAILTDKQKEEMQNVMPRRQQ